jgi:hypothetical protein
MTLIVTHINSYGIVHATDGNLTTTDGTGAGEAQKVFGIPFLNAGLTVAGAYSVGGQKMDHWLDKFIQGQQQVQCRSLQSFANSLAETLQAEMTQDEKSSGSMVHIAGYVFDANSWHPEFLFVRNVYSIDMETGEYRDFRKSFQVSEDFWRRDWERNNLERLFTRGGYQIYSNGFPSGRMSYMFFQEYMTSFFNQIWANNAWRFRPPNSLKESELVVDLYIRAIGVLFHLSDYRASFIGGTPQTYVIPAPTSASWKANSANI